MIKSFECLLCKMGWDVDRIVDHYEYGGYKVWEFHPAEGLVWLEAVSGRTRPVTSIHGVVG